MMVLHGSLGPPFGIPLPLAFCCGFHIVSSCWVSGAYVAVERANGPAPVMPAGSAAHCNQMLGWVPRLLLVCWRPSLVAMAALLPPRVQENRTAAASWKVCSVATPVCAGDPPAGYGNPDTSSCYPRVCGGTYYPPEVDR